MFKIIPHGRFCVCEDYEMPDADKLDMPVSHSDEALISVKVVRVGSLVNAERENNEIIVTDSIALVKKGDVNYNYFNGQKVIYIDGDFLIHIEEVVNAEPATTEK